MMSGSIMQGKHNHGKRLPSEPVTQVFSPGSHPGPRVSILPPGTPRTSAEAYEESMKYGKQIKRESPPIRSSFEGGIGKGKPYEGGVNTIKEMGRSIHEIPRQEQPGGQDSRKTPDMADSRRHAAMEAAMSQVSAPHVCVLWGGGQVAQRLGNRAGNRKVSGLISGRAE